MTGGNGSLEVSVRRAFARLTSEDLPRAAALRGWPVRTSEDFERLLLDHLRDDEAGRPATPCLVDLILAVELGEGLLAGELCCRTMSARLRSAVCDAAASGEGDYDGGGDPIAAFLAAFARKRNRLPM